MNNNFYNYYKNTINFLFGIEWSGCYYLALDCKKSKRNKKHYPKIVYEVNGNPSNFKKIFSVKKFNMKKKSVEDWGTFGKWIPKQKEIDNVIKFVNMVPPS